MGSVYSKESRVSSASSSDGTSFEAGGRPGKSKAGKPVLRGVVPVLGGGLPPAPLQVGAALMPNQYLHISCCGFQAHGSGDTVTALQLCSCLRDLKVSPGRIT